MAETKKQEVAAQGKQEMNTQLSYYANQYTGLMERDFAEHGLVFDDYSKQCNLQPCYIQQSRYEQLEWF